jgi:hypothetical protein
MVLEMARVQTALRALKPEETAYKVADRAGLYVYVLTRCQIIRRGDV